MQTTTNGYSYSYKIFTLISLSLLFYVLINVVSYRIDGILTDYGRTVGFFNSTHEDKFFMLKDMHKEKPNIIFIGNSQTGTYIDTSKFYRHGLRVLNYSFVAFFIAQYPDMVRNAISLKPDIITISVTLADLFNEPDYILNHYNYNNDISSRDVAYLFTPRTGRN